MIKYMRKVGGAEPVDAYTFAIQVDASPAEISERAGHPPRGDL